MFDHIKSSIFALITPFFPVGKWLENGRNPLINIFYHTISDAYLPHISPIYAPEKTDEFERDLDFLLKYFQPVSAEDVLLHTTKEKIVTRPSFHLSFDDGLREIYDIIMPILWQKGVPATVFVNSAFVDNNDLFYRYKAALIAGKMPSLQKEVFKIDYFNKENLDTLAKKTGIDFSGFLTQQQPYLTVQQLQEMQQKGFTIGSHSIDHPLYSLLSEDEQVRQTLVACDFVKQNFNEKYTFFAFPFTSDGMKESFFEKIASTVDLTFGIGVSGTAFNRKLVHRIDMEHYGKNAETCLMRALLTEKLKNFLASEN